MTTPITSAIRPRDRDAVIQSLRTGVTPRIGQHLIQVGRKLEVETMVRDIDRLADGGSAFRLVVGEYGAGKSFFLNLIRSIALERKMVVASADLNPDRRLQGSDGKARSLYAELMRNLSTRTKPDGGAMVGIVEKFISNAKAESVAAGTTTEAVIREKLSHLAEMVNGYDFADVIAAYCRGAEAGNDQLKADAVRWLRGEFTTKTDARAALGVRSYVDDASVYDQLKLFAQFVRLAGFSGLLVNLDEMVNLFKIPNTQARNANYEQILRILNDSLQGSACGLGFILGGTPDFLTDTRRGLYSYAALQSRLSSNTFAKDGLVDFSGPVIRLASLTPEDFYVLLQKLRDIYAYRATPEELLPNEAIAPFMQHCAGTIGESYFRTPRTTIRAFLGLLAVLEQNPGASWKDLLGDVKVEVDTGAENDKLAAEDDSDLTSFRL